MHRTSIATAVLLGAATTACAAALTAHAASKISAPPCTPRITKIGGHQAAANCGPATATLRIGGKTYSFRNGFCEQSKAAAAALELDLGTAVLEAKGNAGKPHFTMTIGKNHFVAAVNSADYGGKDLLGGEGLINVRGSIPAKGTFTSRATPGAKFTGSWNCHGVVWQAP